MKKFCVLDTYLVAFLRGKLPMIKAIRESKVLEKSDKPKPIKIPSRYEDFGTFG